MTSPSQVSLGDWIGLGILALLWGSAFAFIAIGLDGVPPAGIAFVRLGIAAGLLTAYAYWRGHRLPPLSDARWPWWVALGFFGNALPFFLIPWAQQELSSGVTGILLAVMPLATVGLAHFFADEPMTRMKFAGFLIGFAGVVVLIGPSALAGLGGPMFIAKLAVLLAALVYAINMILVRRAPQTPPSLSAAGMLITSALWAAPVGLWSLSSSSADMSWTAWSAVVWLGLGPTAIASVYYMRLIGSAGASFASTVNYLVPVVAVLAGFALGETIGWMSLAGLAIILAGIAIARRGQPSRPPRTDSDP